MNLFVLPNYDKFSGKRLEKRYNDLALYAHEVMHLGFSDMPILSLCDKKMDRVKMISQQLNLLSKADFAIILLLYWHLYCKTRLRINHDSLSFI